MKVYRHISDIDKMKGSILSIGSFDGVHLGHQKILETTKSLSLKYKTKAAIISFYPSPFSFLYPEKFNGHIDTDLEKIDKVAQCGIDLFAILRFNDKIRRITAKVFLSDIIVKYFKPKVIVIGYDHHFGLDREGGVQFLNENKDKYNYELIQIDAKKINKDKISSSKIRKLIIDRKVREANKMLGSPFKIKGVVVKGEGLGASIGFPTANIKLDELKLVPGNGVYFVGVSINSGSLRLGMCNIGFRPTINDKNKKLSCEVHILDFDEKIYKKEIEVQFLDFFRLEKKFNSVNQLKKQLIIDKNKCLEYSSNNV